MFHPASLLTVLTLMASTIPARPQFRMFDHDHSGSVTYAEFRESLRHLGFHMSDAEFKKFVAECVACALRSIIATLGSDPVRTRNRQV